MNLEHEVLASANHERIDRHGELRCLAVELAGTGHRVAAVIGAGVTRAPSAQLVLASTSSHAIRPACTRESVNTGTPEQQVLASTTGQAVGPASTKQLIGATAAEQPIRAPTAEENVIAAETQDHVVAGSTADDVVTAGADQEVCTRRSRDGAGGERSSRRPQGRP